jgi:muramoyltetrapeptide carboxypeptidase
VIPPRVARGAKIGVVAPAGPVNLERLRRGLACFGETFDVRVADSVTAARVPGTPSYLAAPDEVRAAELIAMLRDPDIRAVILARGGYGLMRILPMLDPAVLRADPKPIVGFSDATALLAWAHAAGVRGIHGPMIAQMGDLPASDIAQLIRLLTDPTPIGERPWQLQSHGTGRVRGPLVAGNLTLVSLLVGTRWPLPLEGAIALVEEINERPYEIDRYLTQLTLTGALGGIAALVVGDFTRCEDPAPPSGEPDPPDAALQTILDRVGAAGKPVSIGAPIGHGRRNEPVPFGAACELDLDRDTFAILDGAVS